MLIDEVKIKIKGGHGGRGSVHFFKTRALKGPPDGGDGGKGGNVYFEAISDLNALNSYRFQKEFNAENGENGKSNKKTGKSGKDLVLKIPAGTVIHNLSNNTDFEITKMGEIFLAARGGKGGWGNYRFKSSVNRSPKQFGSGEAGEEFEIFLELKMIADIGFVGMPSSGKSSMLNKLTKAAAKTGAYHFTTLEPNLGVMRNLIIADIPGLIEGASKGRGLGQKFLRHIQRTKILVHFLPSDSSDLKKNYETIRNELKRYDEELLSKKEIVFLSKSDLLSEVEVKNKIKEIKKITKNPVYFVSIYDPESLKNAEKELINILKSDNLSDK